MLERKFFIGFIRIHILYHANMERIFGIEIMKELKRHGYEISPGTLYPILHSLEKEGYLKSEKENIDGKIRKYYVITKEGKYVLEKAKNKIKELVEEVMEG